MKSFIKIFSICLFLMCIVQCWGACGSKCISADGNSTVLSRSRRFLDFMKATRVFFRFNIKENVFTWGALWAHASGFKANMNMLNDNKALRPFRRDTYEVLQELLDLHGFDGQGCLLKVFCTATKNADGSMANGILFKLLRHIFTLNEEDRHHFHYLKDENCDQMFHHHCPLSFNNISPYTDDM